MRKEEIITISGGRDNGKKFHIVEMGAYQTEAWATKALLLMLSNNIELPENIKPEDLQGAEGLSMLSKVGYKVLLQMLSQIDYEKVKPLLNELLGCCSFVVEGTETKLTESNAETIVEDMKTLFTLKKKAFGLHFDFFQKESPAK